jgi:antitoxin ParD1/3/4
VEILLPESEEYVDGVVARGAHASASEYIQTLILEDRKRREEQWLEAQLLEALNSGPMGEVTPEDWENVRLEVRRRSAEDRNAGDGDTVSPGSNPGVGVAEGFDQAIWN